MTIKEKLEALFKATPYNPYVKGEAKKLHRQIQKIEGIDIVYLSTRDNEYACKVTEINYFEIVDGEPVQQYFEYNWG